MATKTRIAVLGATGYTGAELLRLLIRHPHVEIVLLHHLRAAPAHPVVEGERDRSRRDRHRCEVGHDRRGEGGEGGDAVLGSLRRLPCLWRWPPPPHGRARPGVQQGRGAGGDREL